MTLDQVCARPGAGAALLTLHRWLPRHAAFEVKQAFRHSAIGAWVQQAAAELTAFSALEVLGVIVAASGKGEPLADRSLMLLAQDDRFGEVPAFLTMHAARALAEQRLRDAGRIGEGFVEPQQQVLDYWLTCTRCLETLGAPELLRLRRADGSLIRWWQS